MPAARNKKNLPDKTPSGPSARRVLMVVLWEFVVSGSHHVWNSVLVEVLMAAGQTEQAARQAIQRAAAAGWLEKRPEGRRVCWTLTPAVLTFLAEGWQHVYPVNRTTWDGRWLILMVSLSESHRAVRDKLYKSLKWAGFGNPSPGLWISPYADTRDEIKRLVRSLGLSDVTFSFIGQALDIGVNDQRLVQMCWDLDGISKHYQDLLARYTALNPRSRDEIFLAHIHLLIEWGKLPLIDPRLPSALLPPDWAGQHAAAELEYLLAEWRRVARARWDEIAERAQP
ncbi:MAG: PaaX family transcriptional regulator C-terminal domain-containing protein [Burkholderiaceae bacterium]|nr:PaaX family transcriptional regulator C-terminal domain-containing protein [Burkholderiaceae bacterium]